MAILSLADFFDELPFFEITFALSSSIEIKSTIGGDVLLAEHGVRFWYGTVTLGHRTHEEHEDNMALIRRLERPDMEFHASPIHWDGRSRDLHGTGPELYSVSNGRDLRFSGVTAGAQFRRGTFVSLVYGGRSRLHQFGATVTANGSGIVGPVEIVPDLEDGWTLNQAVAFNRPFCHAVMVPKSVAEVPLRGRASQGIRFGWRQQLL